MRGSSQPDNARNVDRVTATRARNHRVRTCHFLVFASFNSRNGFGLAVIFEFFVSPDMPRRFGIQNSGSTTRGVEPCWDEHGMTRPRHTGRRLVLWLLLVAGTWVLLEIISFTALSALNRSWFSRRTFASEMKLNVTASSQSGLPATPQTELRWNDYVEVLHPYFGYVADPQANTAEWAVSDSGFVFSAGVNPVTKRSPERLVVAVFGGSFANGQYLTLRALLESKSAELNKRVEVLNFSSAGYKQPQHLMVLSHLLAQGAEFDIVITIDGFNDVVLPSVENIPAGVNPFFPRGWDRRTAGTISQAEIRRVGFVEFRKRQRAEWSRLFLAGRLYVSPTCCLIWKLRDHLLARDVSAAEQRGTTAAGAKTYTMRGPRYSYADEEHLFTDLANFWKNSSIQMDALCTATGARYYHFLQPNQYVPNSKPMDEAESRRAITKGHPYEKGVHLGYPRLVQAGTELTARGVNFSDLTHVFDDVREPVYVDDCCHLNETGYAIIARRIYDRIQQKP
jgi:hypothetical protein